MNQHGLLQNLQQNSVNWCDHFPSKYVDMLRQNRVNFVVIFSNPLKLPPFHIGNITNGKMQQKSGLGRSNATMLYILP